MAALLCLFLCAGACMSEDGVSKIRPSEQFQFYLGNVSSGICSSFLYLDALECTKKHKKKRGDPKEPAIVRFTIHRDGTVDGIILHKKSDLASTNRLALAALDCEIEHNLIKPLPKIFDRESITVDVAFDTYVRMRNPRLDGTFYDYWSYLDNLPQNQQVDSSDKKAEQSTDSKGSKDNIAGASVSKVSAPKRTLRQQFVSYFEDLSGELTSSYRHICELDNQPIEYAARRCDEPAIVRLLSIVTGRLAQYGCIRNLSR